jgi:hypothetical protein
MDNWITFSGFGWAITIAVTFGIGKRLGHELRPGSLNATGSIVLIALLAPLFLVYWAIVESPNERWMRELEGRVGQCEATRP